MDSNNELTPEYLESLFRDDGKCLGFLASVKWKDGFICGQCGNTNYCPGKSPYSRRCTRCKKEESVTSGTIFHHCRFPLSKAFYMAYHICRSGEEISTYEFARRLSLRQMTCWNFKKKVKVLVHKHPDVMSLDLAAFSNLLTEKPRILQ